MELIRAVGQANMQGDKLITYCKAIKNIAVIKRVGFLVELLELKGLKSFIHFARKEVNNKYNLFDPQGLDEGAFVADWRLRLNISREELLDIADKQY